jgi:TetR/AcrR family transcriptional regulator, transcriptional repressor for nem operon
VKQESESKRKLLEAAMEMIWESSYGSVSVDDICTKAGVNKGSFYYAFKSKSDLAVAAFERYWENKRPLMDKIFSAQVPPLERLDNYCQVIIKDQKTKYESFGKMLGCPFCSVGSELSTQDEKIRLKADQMSQRMIKYNESLVRDLASAGLIEVKDTTELAQKLYSYVTGVLMQAKIENSVKHVERLQHGVMRLLGIKQLSAAVA